MKKLLLPIAVAFTLLFTSCEKDVSGKCGTVYDFPYAYGPGTYKLPVRFDDGHKQDVIVDATTIVNYWVGQKICF